MEGKKLNTQNFKNSTILLLAECQDEKQDLS